MKGLGVLVSLNIGKLIATLEPRRRRILAVRVLVKVSCKLAKGPIMPLERENLRETNMGVGDFIWEEETVASLGVVGVMIGIREWSWNTETRE